MKFKKFLTVFIIFTILFSLLIIFFPVMEESYSIKNARSEPFDKGACIKYEIWTNGASYINGSIHSSAGAYIYLKGNGNSYSITVNTYNHWANESAGNSSCIEDFLIYPHQLNSGDLVIVNGVTGVIHETFGFYENICNTRINYNHYEVSQSFSHYCFLPTSELGVLLGASCCQNTSKSVNLLNDIFMPMGISLGFSKTINGNIAPINIHLTLLKSNVKFTSIDYYGYFINSLPILIIFLVFDTSFLLMLIQRVKLKRKRLNNADISRNRNSSFQSRRIRKKWKF